jgi:hypothetical protein
MGWQAMFAKATKLGLAVIVSLFIVLNVYVILTLPVEFQKRIALGTQSGYKIVSVVRNQVQI